MATLLLGPSCLTVAGLALLTLPLAKKRNIRGVRGRLWTAPNLNATLGTGPVYCRLCTSTGFIPCNLCQETGALGRGGFARRNNVRVSALVGTQWTSVSAIDGKWRHFRCIAKKGRNAKDGIAILSSTCGPVANRIQIEVPVKQLKSREVWEGGWTTLKDIRAGCTGPPTVCSACRGQKTVMCPRCDGLGQVGL